VCLFMTWLHGIFIMSPFEATYVKCVKMFFGYARLDIVPSMFFYLGLPTIGTNIHNARGRFAACFLSQHNSIRLAHAFCAF